jgi:hypothetical protein
MNDIYKNPARAMSLMGKRKLSEVQRGQAVRQRNGVSAKQGLKHALSSIDNMSAVEKYHATQGKGGSIINKALGGRFG